MADLGDRAGRSLPPLPSAPLAPGQLAEPRTRPSPAGGQRWSVDGSCSTSRSTLRRHASETILRGDTVPVRADADETEQGPLHWDPRVGLVRRTAGDRDRDVHSRGRADPDAGPLPCRATRNVDAGFHPPPAPDGEIEGATPPPLPRPARAPRDEPLLRVEQQRPVKPTSMTAEHHRTSVAERELAGWPNACRMQVDLVGDRVEPRERPAAPAACRPWDTALRSRRGAETGPR